MKRFLKEQFYPEIGLFTWKNILLQIVGASIFVVVFVLLLEDILILLEGVKCWEILNLFVLVDVIMYIFIRLSKLFDGGIAVSLMRVFSASFISFFISSIFVLLVQNDVFRGDMSMIEEFFKSVIFISLFGIFGALVLDCFSANY